MNPNTCMPVASDYFAGSPTVCACPCLLASHILLHYPISKTHSF